MKSAEGTGAGPVAARALGELQPITLLSCEKFCVWLLVRKREKLTSLCYDLIKEIKEGRVGIHPVWDFKNFF